MGKKCKKKVQWKQLSLSDFLITDTEKQTVDDCDEEEGDSAPHTPTHENSGPYPRHPYKPNFNNSRRGFQRHHGFYHKNFERHNGENFGRDLDRGSRSDSPYEKPFGKPFYERNYHYDKFGGRPPFYGDRNFKFGPGGFVDRGRRPFRPYGRGFFPPRGFHGHFHGPPFRDGFGKGVGGCEGEEEDEEWDDEGILVSGDGTQPPADGVNGDKPSQLVHTVMINNEEYTKIQTPRQEVIFKKSSLDRKRDSIDQGSVTGSMTSGSGSSSTTGGEPGSGSAGSGDQVAGDGSSVSESVEDNSLSVTGDDPPDGQPQDQVFEDPNEIFVGEPGGPPLAGVVMQQAYPGGPMITIPVHWTPFIDPGLIPGDTALTPLDPAFTHVIDPKALPIDPLHILPVQHDASGCPVHVQVKVDSNGVPIQIQPTAFTVSLSSLQQHQEQQQHQQQGVINQQQPHQQQQPPENEQVQPELRGTQPEEESTAEEQDGSEKTPLSEIEAESHPQGVSETLEEQHDQKTITEDEDGCKDSSGTGQRAAGEQHVEVGEGELLHGDNQNEERNASEAVEIGEVESDENMAVEEENVSVSEVPVEEEEMKEVVEEEMKVEEAEMKEVEETEKKKEVTEEEEAMEAEDSEDSISRTKTEENEMTRVDHIEDDMNVEEAVEPTEEVRTNQPEERSEETPKVNTAAVAAEDSNQKTDSEASKDTSPAADPRPAPAETVTTPAVPSTDPEAAVKSAPAGESRSSRRRKKRRRKNGKAEEETPVVTEVVEEKTLNKDTEVTSDSSDSQYASMSESSSIPTTPEGEPSDSHEAPESQVEDCKTSPEVDSVVETCSATEVPVPCETEDDSCIKETVNDEAASQTSGTKEIDETHAEEVAEEEEETEDAKEGSQQQEEEEEEEAPTTEEQQQSPASTNEQVSQGYVMVPILTPYYDPSVLYGYPVVVADQHQHQHQPRGYSKRKKKKYQRRRHVEGPSAGCYLDPQLYTGEPFVATPGGYVVPVEAPQVCQVHGFQYVTSPFQPHPEEGFIQHSPYMPGVVPDLLAQQAQHLGGTNIDDASRRTFSDLQERERRQIQEILQEQRAKVGKSDSTESSDSGVSESEEAVAPELSSEENLGDKTNATECNEESTDATEEPEAVNTSVTEDASMPEAAKESLQCEKLADSIKDNTSTSTDEQIHPLSDSASTLQSLDSIDCHTNGTSQDTEKTKSLSISKDDQNAHSSCDVSNPDNESTEQEEILCASNEVFETKSPTPTITGESEENLDDLGNKSECDFTELPQDLNKSSVNTSVQSFEEAKSVSDIDSLPQSHATTVSQLPSTCLNKLPLELGNAQDNPTASNSVQESTLLYRIDEDGTTEESSIKRESLKDLKVTEAVKRWIREVTPEKAFLLSEVQTRLLESDLQEEMDTEDEYIEDEMPPQGMQTKNEESSKNVLGNPFAATSNETTPVGMEGCSKRVAFVRNKLRGLSPDTLEDYDGSSTISNLSYDHLYSEASSSQPASFSHSFDEEEGDKYSENPSMYNPVAYAKYYQLGVEVDDATPSATPVPQNGQISREATPVVQTESETLSECGSEDIETIPHKYDVVCQYTSTSPMSLATEILKAEKVLSNMSHITGSHQEAKTSQNHFGNPDVYLKHYGNALRTEVGDSGVQSEESSDEMEGRSNVGSSGVGSSLASTPAISPAHITGRPPLQPHPLKNLSAGEGPVPCRTVCCAVM